MNQNGTALRDGGRIWTLIVFMVLIVVSGCAVEPETWTEVRQLRDIELSHTNVGEYIGEGSPDIVVVSEGSLAGVLMEEGLRLHFRERGTENFTKVIMGAAGSASVYLASIPHFDRGKWIEYYIEVRGVGGELLTFPGNTGEGVYYPLRFKGRVPLPLISLHVGTMFLGLLLFAFASYKSWRYLKSTGGYEGIEKISVYGLTALFIGGFPLGFLMGYFTFGTPWTGFPVGGDVTDTKTLIVFFYWLLAVGLFRSSGADPDDDRKQRRYANLVIWGTVFTVIIYAIPHSI
jgi:hypothetical protein